MKGFCSKRRICFYRLGSELNFCSLLMLFSPTYTGHVLKFVKTEFILIGSKPMIKKISDSYPNIFIENEKIKQVYECKTLGVKVDQHLSWKRNTESILLS